MRFETARVLQTVEDLEAAARLGPAVEDQLADALACGFERIGWHCERQDVSGSRFPELVAPWVGWVGLCGWMTLGATLTYLQYDTTLRLLPYVLALLWLPLTARYGFRFGWGLPPWGEARLLVAGRASAHAPAGVARLLIQTPLGPMAPPRARDRWWRSTDLFGLVLAGSCLVSFLDFDAIPASLRSLVLPALAWLWVAGVARAVEGVWTGRAGPKVSLADLTGPACLLELARVWPAHRAEHVELVMVAAGGQRLDFAGAREVAHKLNSEWPVKPTLLILLLGPGIGEELFVVSRDHHRLGEQAAAGLWIPHRTIKSAEALVQFWPLQRKVKDHLAITGDEWITAAEPRIDESLLRRSGELAMEIGLRWAKETQQKL
jgi:hypothetical protein